ncbi:MAG: RNA polymerase factor sigma-32 [Caulobacterales bacterium]
MSQTRYSARDAGADRFVAGAMRAEMLSLKDEAALATAWRQGGDQKALHRLTGAYMRLVIAIARRHKGYGLPEGDLIQEGSIGLLHAANRYEAERGLRFSTYAAWWIRAAIQDFILRNWSIVRLGSTANQKSLFFKLRGLRAALGDLTNTLPDHDARMAIAARLGVKESDVEAMAVRLSGADPSLNAPARVAGDDNAGLEWQELLIDDNAHPEVAAIAAHDDVVRKRVLETALAVLNPRQRTVIMARRGSDEPKTLEALGAEMGVTKERVRQIEVAALEKMRQRIMAELGAVELQSLMPDC